MFVTYRYRVKDKHTALLNSHSRAVNFVWNFCNDTQKSALKWGKKWPSGFDLMKLTTGSSKELGVSADTINCVCSQYHKSRKQRNKASLRYRGKKSLGWVPMRAAGIKLHENGFCFFGQVFTVWYSRPIPDNAKIVDGSSFSQDSRGNWYVNVCLELPETLAANDSAVGIDLGLKDLACLSNGEKVKAPQHFRKSAQRLATAQRARKKRQVTKIHAKIAAQRRDHLHKVSTNIVKSHGLIVVGNVNSSALAKTRMAKSVLDAGWANFKDMIAYKSIRNGVTYLEVNEAYTTQTCSSCGVIGGPKGREGLSVREWQCDCGSVHDRDTNSALNILRIGQDTLRGAALSGVVKRGNEKFAA